MGEGETFGAKLRAKLSRLDLANKSSKATLRQEPSTTSFNSRPNSQSSNSPNSLTRQLSTTTLTSRTSRLFSRTKSVSSSLRTLFHSHGGASTPGSLDSQASELGPQLHAGNTPYATTPHNGTPRSRTPMQLTPRNELGEFSWQPEAPPPFVLHGILKPRDSTVVPRIDVSPSKPEGMSMLCEHCQHVVLAHTQGKEGRAGSGGTFVTVPIALPRNNSVDEERLTTVPILLPDGTRSTLTLPTRLRKEPHGNEKLEFQKPGGDRDVNGHLKSASEPALAEPVAGYNGPVHKAPVEGTKAESVGFHRPAAPRRSLDRSPIDAYQSPSLEPSPGQVAPIPSASNTAPTPVTSCALDTSRGNADGFSIASGYGRRSSQNFEVRPTNRPWVIGNSRVSPHTTASSSRQPVGTVRNCPRHGRRDPSTSNTVGVTKDIFERSSFNGAYIPVGLAKRSMLEATSPWVFLDRAEVNIEDACPDCLAERELLKSEKRLTTSTAAKKWREEAVGLRSPSNVKLARAETTAGYLAAPSLSSLPRINADDGVLAAAALPETISALLVTNEGELERIITNANQGPPTASTLRKLSAHLTKVSEAVARLGTPPRDTPRPCEPDTAVLAAPGSKTLVLDLHKQAADVTSVEDLLSLLDQAASDLRHDLAAPNPTRRRTHQRARQSLLHSSDAETLLSDSSRASSAPLPSGLVSEAQVDRERESLCSPDQHWETAPTSQRPSLPDLAAQYRHYALPSSVLRAHDVSPFPRFPSNTQLPQSSTSRPGATSILRITSAPPTPAELPAPGFIATQTSMHAPSPAPFSVSRTGTPFPLIIKPSLRRSPQPPKRRVRVAGGLWPPKRGEVRAGRQAPSPDTRPLPEKGKGVERKVQKELGAGQGKGLDVLGRDMQGGKAGRQTPQKAVQEAAEIERELRRRVRRKGGLSEASVGKAKGVGT